MKIVCRYIEKIIFSCLGHIWYPIASHKSRVLRLQYEDTAKTKGMMEEEGDRNDEIHCETIAADDSRPSGGCVYCIHNQPDDAG